MECYSDFEALEYQSRRAKLCALMATEGVDAVLINSEENHRYFTGHWSDRWMNKARPMFSVITAAGKAFILCSRVEEGMATLTAQGCEIHTYGGPGFNLQAPLDALTGIINDCVPPGGVVGFEGGNWLSFTIPLADFDALRQLAKPRSFRDTSALFWRIRIKKSEAEVQYMRTAAGITSKAFAAAFGSSPRTESDLYRRFRTEVLRGGGDRVGFVTITGDMAGTYRGGFTDRELQPDQMGNMDGGCVVHGYYADFCRAFFLGRIPEDAKAVMRQGAEIHAICREEIKPGRTWDDVHAAIMRRTATGYPLMKTAGVLGRLGHGIGLTQPEPPSIWSEEKDEVEVGMTVCVEPSFHDPKWGRMILEETIVVTPTGAQLISDGTCAELRSI